MYFMNSNWASGALEVEAFTMENVAFKERKAGVEIKFTN